MHIDKALKIVNKIYKIDITESSLSSPKRQEEQKNKTQQKHRIYRLVLGSSASIRC
jgi:hypothetical protein